MLFCLLLPTPPRSMRQSEDALNSALEKKKYYIRRLHAREGEIQGDPRLDCIHPWLMKTFHDHITSKRTNLTENGWAHIHLVCFTLHSVEAVLHGISFTKIRLICSFGFRNTFPWNSLLILLKKEIFHKLTQRIVETLAQ